MPCFLASLLKIDLLLKINNVLPKGAIVIAIVFRRRVDLFQEELDVSKGIEKVPKIVVKNKKKKNKKKKNRKFILFYFIYLYNI